MNSSRGVQRGADAAGLEEMPQVAKQAAADVQRRRGHAAQRLAQRDARCRPLQPRIAQHGAEIHIVAGLGARA